MTSSCSCEKAPSLPLSDTLRPHLEREMMMDMHGKMSVGKQVEVCYVSNTTRDVRENLQKFKYCHSKLHKEELSSQSQLMETHLIVF